MYSPVKGNEVKTWSSENLMTSELIFNSKDETNQFEIIKNGCLSDLVSMRRFSEKYSKNSSKLSYNSFSFSPDGSSFDLSLFCEIDFCLLENNEKICAEEIDENCPDTYSYN